MSHVTPLTRFFLSNQFWTSINENNIIRTGGKVVHAYATLMKDLWMGGHQFSSLSPTALKQAIEKANSFNFDLKGAVMASDAFFPFPDCVEIAKKAGITAVIQPGGSIKDQLSIDYCNENKVAMVFTGTRHFKH